uniref:Uncharacterized protein n=1 Tax=Ditylenchus dipsaci TaxID=166011 RepID=A0A915D7G8_9BILA
MNFAGFFAESPSLSSSNKDNLSIWDGGHKSVTYGTDLEKYESEVKLAMVDIPDDVPFLEKLNIGQWIQFTAEMRKGDYFVVGLLWSKRRTLHCHFHMGLLRCGAKSKFRSMVKCAQS